jgi:hypothetical protein
LNAYVGGAGIVLGEIASQTKYGLSQSQEAD